MGAHAQVREIVLNLLTVIVEQEGLRYSNIELVKKHIDAAVERMILTVEAGDAVPSDNSNS